MNKNGNFTSFKKFKKRTESCPDFECLPKITPNYPGTSKNNMKINFPKKATRTNGVQEAMKDFNDFLRTRGVLKSQSTRNIKNISKDINTLQSLNSQGTKLFIKEIMPEKKKIVLAKDYLYKRHLKSLHKTLTKNSILNEILIKNSNDETSSFSSESNNTIEDNQNEDNEDYCSNEKPEKIVEKVVEQEKTSKPKPRRQRRSSILFNMKRYANSNGCNKIKDFLQMLPNITKPYDMLYGEDFLDAVKHNEILKVEQALKIDPALLLEHDYLQQTPFHWAAKFGYARLLKTMIKYGNCYNLYDIKKRTPLYFAALYGRTECVRVLLDAGVYVDFPDINGKFPYQVAYNREIRTMIERQPKIEEINRKFDNVFSLAKQNAEKIKQMNTYKLYKEEREEQIRLQKIQEEQEELKRREFREIRLQRKKLEEEKKKQEEENQRQQEASGQNDQNNNDAN